MRRRFTIDDHLGRHSKALGSLFYIGADAIEEVKAYVVKNALYSDALALYKADVKIHQVFQEYLSILMMLTEAGLHQTLRRLFVCRKPV